jgi:hypothetical protein
MLLACILSVRAFSLSLLNSTLGFAWEINGMIVTPECPPTTGTFTFVGSKFCFHENKMSRETDSASYMNTQAHTLLYGIKHCITHFSTYNTHCITPSPCFTPICFMPFCFNTPRQFPPPPFNLCPPIFSLMPFGWLRSIMLTPCF